MSYSIVDMQKRIKRFNKRYNFSKIYWFKDRDCETLEDLKHTPHKLRRDVYIGDFSDNGLFCGKQLYSAYLFGASLESYAYINLKKDRAVDVTDWINKNLDAIGYCLFDAYHEFEGDSEGVQQCKRCGLSQRRYDYEEKVTRSKIITVKEPNFVD